MVTVKYTMLMQVQGKVTNSAGKNINEYISRDGFGNIYQKLLKCLYSESGIWLLGIYLPTAEIFALEMLIAAHLDHMPF